ncbi:RpiB/LacA/LacB family sugar-phosphate isomerase [Candidatus Pacearchaeota archaeon]|nr:RpiB/LacA/LacB family sugar-phosphate isomerase [Candidatus Pacearchaeota archaeon]
MKREEISIVFLGADHAGFVLKSYVKKYLQNRKIKYLDFSSEFKEGDDYPDVAFKVAEKVARFKNSRGVLLCGTGTGMAIAANKVRGIRAVDASDVIGAKLSREHNNTNILTLGAWLEGQHKLREILSVWLNTSFSGEIRHKRRLAKIAKYENGRK